MRLIPAVIATLGLTVTLLGTPGQTPTAAASKRTPAPTKTQIAHTSFDSAADFTRGHRKDAIVHKDGVRLSKPTRTRKMGGRTYELGSWRSPWVNESYSFDELIPSWQARTPGKSLVEVQVRVRSTVDGRTTTGSWDTVARWTKNNTWYKRKSHTAGADDLARVAVDTVKTNSTVGATGWQVKLVLLRRVGSKALPRVDRIGAMTSRVVTPTTTSKPGRAAGTVLAVRRYSQMIHRGHHPEWGNGGEAWCSPTATAMVMQYYGANPRAGRRFKINEKGHQNGIVDWTARQTYDHRYKGTGNWAFNAAHAGTYLRHTYVTRLRDLRAAEAHITAGTPLIVSIAFGRGQLKGAPISSTAGHLVVLVGFDAAGNPVVNDPAAAKNSQVRRTYDRAQFEKAWLTKSGGLTYVYED